MDRSRVMLLGTLTDGGGTMPCLIGIERHRVIVVAQDDLSRYSWPIDLATMDQSMCAMVLTTDAKGFRFTPDLPDRFRWVMTAALQEAVGQRMPWWRRRKPPAIRGLGNKLSADRLAA